MTPDSPKGPESEARPESAKYERFDLPTWVYAAAYSIEPHEVNRSDGGFEDLERELLEAHEMQNKALAALLGLPDDADDGDIADEIARQRSEVERLTAELQAQNRLYRAVGSERDEKQFEIERLRRWVDRFRERAAEHAAEVSRLREQLAAQPPPDLVERAAIWLFRSKTSQMLPDVLQRANKTWHQVLDQCDRDAWIYYARQMLADLGWGVSSSEVEAPQQHTVTFESVYPGVHRAVCRTCGQDSGEGVGEYAALWKDQHEADTLRPTGVQPGGFFEEDEPLEEVVAAFGHGLKFTTAPSTSAAPVHVDEGRPSGSERLAPHSDDTLVAQLRLLVARLKANVRTGEEKGLPNEIAFDDGWCGAMVHAGNELETLLDQYGPGGWDVAAQAARSEATPEALAAHAKVMADQYRQFADLIEQHAPSPSLPKEGEDTHG